jgi:hypothetical protein
MANTLCSREEHLARKQQLYSKFGDEIERILAPTTLVGETSSSSQPIQQTPPQQFQPQPQLHHQSSQPPSSSEQQLEYLLRKKGVLVKDSTPPVTGITSASSIAQLGMASYTPHVMRNTNTYPPAQNSPDKSNKVGIGNSSSSSQQLYQLLAARGVGGSSGVAVAFSPPEPKVALTTQPPISSMIAASGSSSRLLGLSGSSSSGNMSSNEMLNDLSSIEHLLSKFRTYCIRLDAENAELRQQLNSALLTIQQRDAECRELHTKVDHLSANTALSALQQQATTQPKVPTSSSSGLAALEPLNVRYPNRSPQQTNP